MRTLNLCHNVRNSLTFIGLLGFSLQADASPPEPDAGLAPFPSTPVELTPPAPPSEVPSDCGLGDDPVPEFELIDLNPGSSTYTQSYTLSTFQSQVLVIYWALAS